MSEGGFFHIPLPEEMREAMEAAADRRDMEAKDFRNSIDSIFESVSVDQLISLRTLMHMMEGNPSISSYMQGKISGILKYKYNLCESCGKDHELELLTEEAEKIAPEPVEFGEIPGQEELPFAGVLPSIDEERARVMEQYNVRYPEPGEVEAGPDEDPVICKGCGMLYQSLADRRVREPGIPGCHTCIEKQKWG